mgnify:CR=1 FL=1
MNMYLVSGDITLGAMTQWRKVHIPIFVAFAVSFLTGVWIIRSAKAHARLYRHDMPQRFHAGAVPRLGGVALGMGMLSAWLVAASAVVLSGVALVTLRLRR